ncbi:MAG: DUF368 domain-containing protein [Candidatus Absconditabacterales bacterium]|nr:DUF368 domain-containing protein [Candidatus Absconditabacterales bacterium]
MVFLKGLLMGTCDVIPGVSGGTIAFITGIYDDLIDALYAFNKKTLKLLLKGKIKEAWKAINGNFLVLLFGGIFVAIFTFAKLINYLLFTYPSFVWAFFFGLILASAIILRKSLKKKKTIYLLFLLIGLIVGYYLVSLPAINLGTGLLTMFFSGFIAIIAMILPGISGSYILVILGQYQEVLSKVVAIVEGNFQAIIPLLIFIVGAVIGILSFAKLLHWIKSKWHDQMVVVLIGFILGSLNKIWPWKKTISTFIDRHGETQALVEKNILPARSNEVLLTTIIFIIGFGIVLLIDYLARKSKK